MATNATWTVVFEDKKIIKQTGSDAAAYEINDDSFWTDPKWSNIWAIQYHDDNLDHNDTVEYRDETPHATWNNAGLGDFTQLISKWEAAHLAKLQFDWDDSNLYEPIDFSNPNNPLVQIPETEAEKIARIGERPTSYTVS
jgi:hypothetical protein